MKVVGPKKITMDYSANLNFRRQKILSKLLSYCLVTILCLLIVIPFIFMVATSFKPKEEIFTYPPDFFPRRWTLGNYLSLFVYPGMTDEPLRDSPGLIALKEQGKIPQDIIGTGSGKVQVLRDSSMWRVYCNVLLIVLTNAVGAIIVGGLASYALAKIKFPGRELIFMLFLTTIMIPWMVVLLPQYLIFKNLGWVNTFFPLIIPGACFGLMSGGVIIFFFRQHFKTIPDEIVESGIIDGASHWNIFWYFIMPMSKHIILAVLVLTMLYKWNNLIQPLIYITNPRLYTPVMLTYNLLKTVGNETDPLGKGLQMAAATVSVLPVLITFFTAQKYFITGLTSGAVKQ